MNLYKSYFDQQQEAVANTPEDTYPTQVDSSPSWVSSHLVAASNHSEANGNFSIWDTSTWGAKIESAGKFAEASFLSGVNSYYNSFGAIGNFFGGDFEERTTAAYIAEVDSDLSNYYVENQEGADIAGFIAGSIIPGLGGIKVFNMGQKALQAASKTGFVGKNIAQATGLLNNSLDRQILLSAKELANKQAVFSYTTQGTLKAVGSGFVQAAWETAAFELAVNATMFKSPVLENQTYEDLAKNMMLGTVFGGVIGGAINVARLKSGIDKALTQADEILMPVSSITSLPKASVTHSSDITVSLINDLERVRNTPFPADNGLVELATFQTRQAETISKLNNAIRESIRPVVGGDVELANMVADGLDGMRAFDASTSLWNIREAGRLTTELATEKTLTGLQEKLARFGRTKTQKVEELKALYAKQDEGFLLTNDMVKSARVLKMQAGKAKKAEARTAEALATAEKESKVMFVKLHGEDAGTTGTSLPTIFNVADTVPTRKDVVLTYAKTKFSPEDSFGTVTDHLEAEAMYFHADKLKYKDGMIIGEDNIPALEGALAEMTRNSGKLSTVELADGTTLHTAEEVMDYLKTVKEQRVMELLEAGELSTDEIAKIANVRRSLVEGDESSEFVADYFARQHHNETYTKKLVAKGLRKADEGTIDTRFLPSVMKVSYDTSKVAENTGMITEAMASIEASYRIYHEGVMRAVTAFIGDAELAAQLRPISAGALLQANRLGSQPGLLSFNNSNYLSLGSEVQNLGKVTALIEKRLLDELSDTVGVAIERLKVNASAAREFMAIHKLIAASPERYVPDATGKLLKARRLVQYEEAVAAGKKVQPPKFAEGVPVTFAIKEDDTWDALLAHQKANARYVNGKKLIGGARGQTEAQLNALDPNVIYPIRKDYRDFKHFAFVVDPTVTGYGHVSMIHAANAAELENMMTKARADGLKTITDKASKDFHKAVGDYEYSRTLNENHIDTRLKARGVDSEWLPPTDPQVITDLWSRQLTNQYRTMAKESVRAVNEREFAELERLGEQYTAIESSQYASNLKSIEATVNNPYMNYVKTALNISALSEHPLLVAANNTLDKAFSVPVNKVTDLWRNFKSTDDIAKINAEMQSYGIKSAYATAADILYANHSAGRGALSKFVGTANSIIAALALRTDPFNAITNAVSSNILLSAETKYIKDAIFKSGNKQAIGELAELGKVKLVGTDRAITSPAKLIGEAYTEYLSKDKEQMLAFYKSRGWSPDLYLQQKQLMEDLTLRGGENAAELARRENSAVGAMKKLVEVGERVTLNRTAEELNRFVAARVAERYYDVGLKHGVVLAEGKDAFINTFVNRTQGNMLASQRPLMFQGPIGSALSLFQTYQFNFMQQLFRYVGEGSAKDAAMVLGMQSTVFGLNGLPAFNFINQTLVGNASGNYAHKDLYTSTYAMTGKELGDWVMYGALAGMTGSNIYSRGDLNPRHLTILPTSLEDIPAISAGAKLFSNLAQTISRISGGGDVWESFLQGVEHNGLSRPISGFAQVAQGLDGGRAYATDSQGGLVGSNDLIHLSSLKRLAGGKPFDEAFMNDVSFRLKAYEAKDSRLKEKLRESIRTAVIDGDMLEEESISKFAEEYAKLGGKAKNFNKFMLDQYKTATTPAAMRLEARLKQPTSQMMQEFMTDREF